MNYVRIAVLGELRRLEPDEGISAQDLADRLMLTPHEVNSYIRSAAGSEVEVLPNRLVRLTERMRKIMPPPAPDEFQPAKPADALHAGQPGSPGDYLDGWREKLAFLLEQEPITVDPAQKFALIKHIEEARRKVRELGG